jgi:hypothetical protein
MAGDNLQATVRDKLESAEIQREPFPHLVISDLLPESFFRQLEDSIPPISEFEVNQKGLRANLFLEKHLERGSEPFRAAWGRLRDEIIRGPLTEVLVRRLGPEIREKYAEVYSPEIADEIMDAGLVIPDGRVMLRNPGYTLKPHTDPTRFAVTCLFYFTTASDDSSGALCLFEPERTPEVRHTSTYYPKAEEGIAATLAKVIPISKNLFVAFVNSFRALHGVRVERGEATAPRLAFQAHILPRHDPWDADPDWIARIRDPVSRRRWEDWVAQQDARGKHPTAQPASG